MNSLHDSNAKHEDTLYLVERIIEPQIINGNHALGSDFFREEKF